MHARAVATRLAATGFAACLVAAPVAAQDQSAEFQSFRVPGWSFTPAVAFGVLHDSNVALSSPRASVGDTQGDVLFSIIPSGQLEYLGRQTDFSASYRGFVHRYVEVEGLDGFEQRSSVGFRRTMNRRLTILAQNSYADSPTTDDVEVNGVPFQRRGSRRNGFGAGADIRLTKFTTMAARYDMTWVDFDESEERASLTGGWIHDIRGELGHQISERLSAGGEYSYRAASLTDEDRDLRFQDAGGVLRFRFGPHTTGTAAAGLGVLHDRSTDVTRYGPYVRLGITRALERATVGAGYERSFLPSFGFGGASSSQAVRAHITMPLGQRVYVQSSGSWRRTSPFDDAGFVLDSVRLRSALGFAATRWARVEALYTYTQQGSFVTAGGRVVRHRAGVQFVISQPMRIR